MIFAIIFVAGMMTVACIDAINMQLSAVGVAAVWKGFPIAYNFCVQQTTVFCVQQTMDTVENFNPYAQGKGEESGWAFSPLSKENLLAALRLAINTYRAYKLSWEGLMKRGMEKNYSWNNAAVQYEQVFEWPFIDPSYVK